MKITVNSTTLAMVLAHKKIEKKYKDLGFSPYEEVYDNYVGRRLTPDAKKDYNKHYSYFLKEILKLAIEKEEVKKYIKENIKETEND